MQKRIEVADGVIVDKGKLITKKLNQYRKRHKPKYIEEVEERLNEYFQWCSDFGIVPSIEMLCACLAISRTTLMRWCRGEGCTLKWQNAVLNARQMIYASVEQGGINGDIDRSLSIFMLKNFGWSDTKPLELTVTIDSERAYTHPLELVEKYSRLSEKPRSDALTAPRKVIEQAQPEEIELSATNDPWNVPELFEEDNEPFY